MCVCACVFRREEEREEAGQRYTDKRGLRNKFLEVILWKQMPIKKLKQESLEDFVSHKMQKGKELLAV